MEVRTSRPDDAAAIARVHVRAWRAGYRGIVPDDLLDAFSIADRERDWRRRLSEAGPGSVTLVAVGEDERIEGFCTSVRPSRDPDAEAETAEIAATYVDSDRWGAGIGTALLRGALAELRASGCEQATLWVLAENARALAFYRLFGFEPDGHEGTHERSGLPTVRLRAALDGILLRALAPGDEAELRRIHAAPGVARWWDEPEAEFPSADLDPDTRRLVVELDGSVAGMVQLSEESDPKYRHASIDLFLDPPVHGRGIGTEVVRRVVHHLIGDRGHHRITVDPAAANAAAIRTYEKLGFRRVGLMRRYERDADGEGWHDGLLMELVVDESP